MGPQDLHIIEELHTVSFCGKHSIVAKLLVACVLVLSGCVNHYNWRKDVDNSSVDSS